jgi:nucleoside-diphosphate-sugar epimerase
MKRVTLITGSRGYIGSSLVQVMSDKNAIVFGLDLDLCSSSNFTQSSNPNGLIGDFANLTESELEGVETVIHCAGLSNDATGAIDFRLTHLISHEETVQLARRARSAGVSKFIFLSSCSVYGRSPSMRLSEFSKTVPLTSYAKSKLNAERALTNLASSDFLVYVLRLPTVFGMSKNFRVDLVLNELIVKSVIHSKLQLQSQGLEVRPFISISDLCTVIDFFSGQNIPEISGIPLNVGFNSQNFKIIEAAEIISKEVDLPLTFAEQIVTDPRDYRVAFDKFQEIFPQLCPSVPFEEAIANLVHEVRELATVNGSRLHVAGVMRVNQIKALIEKQDVRLLDYLKLTRNPSSSSYGICCKS